MQIKSLLLLLGAITTTLAFTIPENQPEGVYSVYTHENGTDIHTQIAPSSTSPTTDKRDLPITSAKFRRQNVVSCGGAKALNPGDTDAANADIDRQCGNGALVVSGYNFYAIRDGVVAFVCNFGGNNYCNAGVRQADSAEITSQCGRYNSGWVQHEGSHGISYGYDAATSKFCGVGTG